MKTDFMNTNGKQALSPTQMCPWIVKLVVYWDWDSHVSPRSIHLRQHVCFRH